MKVKEESEKIGLKHSIQKTKIMASGPITSWQVDGEKNGNSDRLNFIGLQNHCRWWLQPWNEKTLAPWKKSYDQPMQHIKKQTYNFINKGLYSQTMLFPVVMYGCESWTLKKAEQWRTDVFELWWRLLNFWRRLLRIPWTARRSNQGYPKGNQSRIFIGRTAAEAETPILWPPNVNNRLIGKDPDAGKDWRWEEKGITEDEMDGWHHYRNGHEFV